MAKTRVFISSTYYDLKYVRDDIERFVLELGDEPVRHETGNIPYAKDTPLEKSALLRKTLVDGRGFSFIFPWSNYSCPKT